jgi:coenzyme Q-binding protein COQ10
MPSHSETRIVPYSADRMYAVVADVEKYPQFLPWCTGLRIVSRDSENVLRAMMEVGFAGIRERYTSKVVLDPAQYAIDVVQIDGPFRKLENRWRFTPRGDTCNVDFSIDFEFRNRLLNAVAGAAFEHVLMKMTDAFEARVRALSEGIV